MFSPLKLYCATMIVALLAVFTVPQIPQVRLNVARATCDARARAAAQRLVLVSQDEFETCVATELR